jgi:hypothetical protein
VTGFGIASKIVTPLLAFSPLIFFFPGNILDLLNLLIAPTISSWQIRQISIH